jgi:hypothetical protein
VHAQECILLLRALGTASSLDRSWFMFNTPNSNALCPAAATAAAVLVLL